MSIVIVNKLSPRVRLNNENDLWNILVIRLSNDIVCKSGISCINNDSYYVDILNKYNGNKGVAREAEVG
jgi:hypothetical protein